MSKVARLFFFVPLVALSFCHLSFAQASLADIDGSRELAGLERYPGSAIIRYQQRLQASYSLALGKVKKMDGAWKPESQRDVRGDWTSLTYRAPNKSSAADVYQHFLTQLKAQGYSEQYACSGLSCGSSNQWANQVFNEKRLYGPKGNQRYFAGKNGSKVVALYVIKRGNKRVYARLDEIIDLVGVADSAPDDLITQLRASGRAVLSLDALSALERSQLRTLVSWLNSDESNDKVLRVVGHRYGAAPLEKLQQDSLADAERFAKQLLDLGVASERIASFGLGPLAPGAAESTSRLVLLLD